MFSEGHNNGIVEGIYRIDHVVNIIDIFPFFKAFLVGPPPVDTPAFDLGVNRSILDLYNLQEGRILTIFRTRSIRYTPLTIPLL